jgi:hypothetical protein
MKNIFSGELKSKKDQKNLESVLKTIITSTKEKTKNEACLKLNEIFENSLEININFDYLLTAIEDLSECSSLQCKKIWLQVTINFNKACNTNYKISLRISKYSFQKNNENSFRVKTRRKCNKNKSKEHLI